MTDPGKSNHWDLLAAELGAEPAPSEAERRQVEPDEEATRPKPQTGGSASTPKATRAKVSSKPRRPSTDWSSLAQQLGIDGEQQPPQGAAPEAESECPAEAVQTPPKATKAPAGPPPALGEFSEDARLGSPLPEVGWTEAAVVSTNPQAELVEPPMARFGAIVESTRTNLVAVRTEPEVPAIRGESAEASGERQEKKSGRKRRKRRSKPQRPVSQQPAEATAGASEVEGEDLSLSGQPDGAAVAFPPAVEEESQERSKRRRRRRSSAKKKDPSRPKDKDEESAEPARAPKLEAEPSASKSLLEVGERSAKPKSDDPTAESSAEKKSKRDKAPQPDGLGHRAIPSWEEAIGLVIAANMEARAKKPGGGSSSRSRGGRNRAGRDRSGDKAN